MKLLDTILYLLKRYHASDNSRTFISESVEIDQAKINFLSLLLTIMSSVLIVSTK